MPDQEFPPICSLFVVVAQWAKQEGMPPLSYWEGETEEWRVSINGTDALCDGVEPRSIILRHKAYIAFVVLGVSGGASTGGPSESEIIAHFNGRLDEPLQGLSSKVEEACHGE